MGRVGLGLRGAVQFALEQERAPEVRVSRGARRRAPRGRGCQRD
jgi:hypothetical protein